MARKPPEQAHSRRKAEHNDCILPLDEIALLDPKEAQRIIYLLFNGTGKGRATRTITTRPDLQWRILVLSSGEEKLPEIIAAAGHGRRTRGARRFLTFKR
jgi:putative DNA primase/helicase